MVVLPIHRMLTSNRPAANIGDHVPMLNIMPFALCRSLANPAVAAATAAAMGVLTPMPCVPVTPAPWRSGAPTVVLDNLPGLNDDSTLNCIWSGVIEVMDPGQARELVP
jgi:hypothetical protein